MVLGPWIDLSFHCHFNHFDGALELLPDGPSKIEPEGMWLSLPVIHMIANARSMHKMEVYKTNGNRHLRRIQMLSKLPTCSDIFKSFRKRYRNKSTDKFMNGKNIRDDLRIMHVQIQMPVSLPIKDNQQRHFAIPFLGNMTGKFGNVTMSVLNNLDKFLPNGVTIREHNDILTQISHSIDNYSICNNAMKPIMVTFNTGHCEKHSVVLKDSTYSNIVSFCDSSSHIMQSFVLYSKYCHPVIIDDWHKDFIHGAVGSGSGNQCCTLMPIGITNLYYGNRSHPTLAQPSPVVGPNISSHHNNYRKNWNACKLASFLQLNNRLISSIHRVSR